MFLVPQIVHRLAPNRVPGRMATVDGSRHLLGAHVPAVAALWLWRRVEPEMRLAAQRFEGNGQPGTARALRFAADELEEAARHVQVADFLDRGSGSGTAEPRLAELVAQSRSVRQLNVTEVAERMGRSQSYVRRLCRDEALAARKVGERAWLVDAASVDDFLTARSSA